MSFNELKENALVKAIAVVLCIAGLSTAMLGGLITIYGYNYGYNTSGTAFEDTKGYRYAVNDRLWRIEEHFFEYVDEDYGYGNSMRYISVNEGSEYFSRENFGMGFEIYQPADAASGSQENEDSAVKDEQIQQIQVENQAAETEDKPENLLLYSNYKTDLVAGEGTYRVDEYIIKYYVDGAYKARDCIYREKRMFEFINGYHGMLFRAGLTGLAVFLLTIIYLIPAAGHRRDSDEIKLNLLDRIPFDIHFAACAAAAFFSAVAMSLCYDSSADGYIYNGVMSSDSSDLRFIAPMAVLFAVISIAVIAFALTSATRIKAGGWWRNTVIFRIIRLAVRFMKWVFRYILKLVEIIPLVWKTTVASAVMLVLIMLTASVHHPVMVLMSLLFAAIFLAGIIYCSLSMRKLQKAGKELAMGNDEYRVDTDRLVMDFKAHGENLNSIGEGINLAVQQRMKSERLKTELITNVSHDIKTPLTSIINYVDLLEKENLDGQAGEYVQIIKRQSARLKKLTQDVVEASKAATGNIEVNLAETDVLEIVNQASAEYRERLEEKGLELIIKNESGAENLIASADGRLLWRSMDNLMSNICKYSLEGSRVYVNTGYMNGNPSISFKNISKNELDISADELMERFVRGDSSRSTEGSGLGLNIARSLIEAQGGTLTISIDGDLFRADIELKRQ